MSTMSGLCSVLETLHKNPDSDLESDDNNDNDNDTDLLDGRQPLPGVSPTWPGPMPRLPTTPSTSESDLTNLSADSDLCRHCQSRATSSSSSSFRPLGRSPRGRGASRERGRGSDRESVGGYNSGYNSDSRPPLPSRSLKTRPSRSSSRHTRSGAPSPSPTLTSSPQAGHQHTSSLDTDCSSDQDKCSDSSAADVVSTGGLLRNKRASRKSKKSVGFAEAPPQELPPPSPSPAQPHPPSPQPLPPPPAHPQGPPSSPLPERGNLFRPISRPSPGPLKANHELLRLIPAPSQAGPGSSCTSKDKDFRPARRPRARSSDCSARAELSRDKTEVSQSFVLSRVSALEALSQSDRAGSPGGVQDGRRGRNGSSPLQDSAIGEVSIEVPKDTVKENFDLECKSSVNDEYGRRKLLHPRPRSASVDRRRTNGLSVGVTSPGKTSSFFTSQISSGSSVTPSPSSTPSPGFLLPSPTFPPPPDSALPQYDEALERIKLLRWGSLQQLPTSPGVSGSCGGRSENNNDSKDGSDDVFTSDDDVRPTDSAVTQTAPSGQVTSSSSKLQSRKTSSSKRIVLEVLV